MTTYPAFVMTARRPDNNDKIVVNRGLCIFLYLLLFGLGHRALPSTARSPTCEPGSRAPSRPTAWPAVRSNATERSAWWRSSPTTGKLWDITETEFGGPVERTAVSGMGGLRVLEGQETMEALAATLNITFQLPESEVELFMVRRQHFHLGLLNQTDIPMKDLEILKMCKLFHKLDCKRANQSITLPHEMTRKLANMLKTNASLVEDHPDLKSFVAAVLSDEAAAYLFTKIFSVV
ncbi:hypothetical protein BV898_08245 [Hypsibius exemplaris]|uniref:Uncharacterized protein n=1 Tax=Hypsibius exemplaris TaxID=2072580 RepID=A0A1W0WQZ0_HYPEX|nr:hypothetical protein BV898_08245 [Hypsibius exemplaris]